MSSEKEKKLILLEKILKFWASLILRRHRPRIIAITGSVGKSSAKEAIYTVLSPSFSTRKNEKNYNNEIGLPLTIIGAQAQGGSIFGWILVFFKAFGIVILPVRYPKVLILEMGADRPGDIGYLASFIRPEMAVVTDISGSHLEYFGTIEKVGKEKWTLVRNLSSKGVATVNVDNPHISKFKNQSAKNGIRFLTYGFSEIADLKASDVIYNYSEDSGQKEIRGISFKLSYKGTTLPFRLNHILARHNIYAALASAAAGMAFGINLVESAKRLENFALPSGRMNLIRGIKNSYLIDDTYNSSPVSAQAALEVFGEISSGRKIAVMGDMLELGADDESGHRSVAQKFIAVKGDIFFAVGRRMRWASEELEKKGFSKDDIYNFQNPMEAGKKLQEMIKEGDLVLIKGSQGMRMEKVVEEVMAEPEHSGDLLCRQDQAWKEKNWREV